jgi:hypothetical protein
MDTYYYVQSTFNSLPFILITILSEDSNKHQ